jgi:hypothetical protein
MYRAILGYLMRLPGAVMETTGKDGKPRQRCIYIPHSLLAANATLRLDGAVDIRKVQELLRRKHVTTPDLRQAPARHVRPRQSSAGDLRGNLVSR